MGASTKTATTSPIHQHQQPRRPASTVDPDPQDQLWSWFTTVDTDCSGALSVQELQQALFNGNWTNFDLDTCRMLMSLFDTDHSGTISFNEFTGLWKYIHDWQKVFLHFDQDSSGSIDGQELANALQSFGYNLSLPILSLIERKYGSLPGDGPQRHGQASGSGGITFDRFVRACVVVKTLTDSFQREDRDRDGWVRMDYETFMRIVLSAP